jgi:hypothetical protein
MSSISSWFSKFPPKIWFRKQYLGINILELLQEDFVVVNYCKLQQIFVRIVDVAQGNITKHIIICRKYQAITSWLFLRRD